MGVGGNGSPGCAFEPTSGGGHGYAVGHGSPEGGQPELASGVATNAAVARAAGAGQLAWTATVAVPPARQRTRKLPSLAENTGRIS